MEFPGIVDGILKEGENHTQVEMGKMVEASTVQSAPAEVPAEVSDVIGEEKRPPMINPVINHGFSAVQSAPTEAIAEASGVIGGEKRPPMMRPVVYHDPGVVQSAPAELLAEVSDVIEDEKRPSMIKPVINHGLAVVQSAPAESLAEVSDVIEDEKRPSMIKPVINHGLAVVQSAPTEAPAEVSSVIGEGKKHGGQMQELSLTGVPEIQHDAAAVLAVDSISKKLEALARVDQCVFKHSGVPFGASGEFAALKGNLCYFDPSAGEYRPLCNFFITGVKKVVVNGVRGMIDSALDFCVAFDGDEVTIRVKEEQWNSFYDEVRKKCPGASYSMEGSKHSRWLEKYLGACIKNAPIESEYLVPGWHEADGKLIFIHDGRTFPGIRCKTGKYIEVDPKLSYVAAFRGAWKILRLAKDLPKILIPFLFTHLGLLVSIFCRAGYQPKFLLFIVGESGALKTEFAKALFALYSGESRQVMATFKDTLTALEVKLSRRGDGTLVIDDYHPNESTSESKAMAEKLEKIVRYQGDGIAKGRSNVNLELKEDLTARCLVACTGEFVSGGESSMLRLLLIELKKGEISGTELETFQNNPRLLATHWQGFLYYVEAHVDEVIAFIQSNFEKKRREWSCQFSEKRLVDAATHLELVGAILLSYGQALEVFATEQVAQLHANWKQCILRVVAQSLAWTKQAKPIVMLLEAIEYIVEQKIEIASSREQYGADTAKWMGFVEGELVYFDHKKICAKATQYWRDHGKPRKLPYSDLFAELAERGISKVYSEGKGRKQYYMKVTISKEKGAKPTRMLAIRIDEMVAFLEAERQA